MGMLKIGVIVADIEEYKPFVASCEKYGAKHYDYYIREGISFTLNGAEVVVLYAGIGKVNAACAAMHLLETAKCNVILSYGLSGGISGVKRGQAVLGTKFLEHDFDLTVIGYKPCEKPGQEYVYDFEGRLSDIAKETFPDIKAGMAVSGDRFICNDADRELFKNNFGAISCDMESAAIASVCKMVGVPFLALRRISDDAGDDANTSYNEMNTTEGAVLSDLFMKLLIDVTLKYGE